jgi:hypothetical protein
MVYPYLACMMLTAHVYQLPPRVLPSIQHVEGGYPGAIHPNTDGSNDLGVMQINTRWVAPVAATIAARTGQHMSDAAVRDRLTNDACFNIAAAGLILRTYFVLGGHDWLRAVGDYHSHTAQLHQDYLYKVTAAAARLFGPRY